MAFNNANAPFSKILWYRTDDGETRFGYVTGAQTSLGSYLVADLQSGAIMECLKSAAILLEIPVCVNKLKRGKRR